MTGPNPILTEVWRGPWVESVHRGCWVAVDSSGSTLAGVGDYRAPQFARSSSKALQALPLFESGAADAHALSTREHALALASHMAEPEHLEVVRAWLGRLGLTDEDLGCGPQPRSGVTAPTRCHNNCSGKHAGFLTLALHLGQELRRYLDPSGVSQSLVRRAVAEMCDVEEVSLSIAVDGCSAPTFRLPLDRLARGIARVANPTGLDTSRRMACESITTAAAHHPYLVGGRTERLDSALMSVTNGRLFAKTGAEGLFVVAETGADRGLAIKVDDGNHRGCELALVEILAAMGWLTETERDALGPWNDPSVENFAGETVGRRRVINRGFG